MTFLIASIPSPGTNSISIGPLTFNAYGLCIGIGALAAIYIAQRRWVARGGNGDDVFEVAKWAVPAGVIGARIYHLVTDWRPIGEWLKIWNGGLGIPGGLIAGIGVGYLVAKRRGITDLPNMLDAAIPGIAVAQAIGRIGNWFNQEIFGGPSDLPWAVEIDNPPAPFEAERTFHPAFLYEATWNLLLFGFLVWIDRRGVLKKGMILPLYVAGYAIGRFIVEAVRIDEATEILGIRVNHWMSGTAILLSALALVFAYRKAAPSHWAVESSDQPDGQPAAS